MARYIDADKIVFWIRYVSSNGMLCDTDVRKVAFSDEIARMPTADVAPRAEVAREIFEEIDKRFEALLGFYPCNGEFEDAKGFVDFHWKYIKRSIMRDYDPDFEKKYTATTDELPKGE